MTDNETMTFAKALLDMTEQIRDHEVAEETGLSVQEAEQLVAVRNLAKAYVGRGSIQVNTDLTAAREAVEQLEHQRRHLYAVNTLGAELANMIEPSVLKNCFADVGDDSVKLLPEDVAVARALLFVVSGSALLDGDRKALRDSAVLYRAVCAANNMLIRYVP